jgi:rhodanese-related sulfurtransferase
MTKTLISSLSVLVVISMLLGACTPKGDQTVSPTQEGLPGGEVPGSGEIPAQLRDYWKTTTKAVDYWSITPVALNTELAGTAPFLVDVRQASEIEEMGYIAGAINIPLRELVDNLDKLPGPVIPIVLYDSTGHRGAMGTMALRMLGYTNVLNLVRGFGGWKSAGFPLVTSSLPAEPILLSAGIIPDETLFPVLDDFLGHLPDGSYTIKADALAAELSGSETPFLADLRLEYEWNDKHIAGATRIDFSALLRSLDQLPPDKNAAIVVYCSDGHRGAMAVEALSLLGYTNIRNLAGGIYSWIAAGQPVE